MSPSANPLTEPDCRREVDGCEGREDERRGPALCSVLARTNSFSSCVASCKGVCCGVGWTLDVERFFRMPGND